MRGLKEFLDEQAVDLDIGSVGWLKSVKGVVCKEDERIKSVCEVNLWKRRYFYPVSMTSPLADFDPEVRKTFVICNNKGCGNRYDCSLARGENVHRVPRGVHVSLSVGENGVWYKPESVKEQFDKIRIRESV